MTGDPPKSSTLKKNLRVKIFISSFDMFSWCVQRVALLSISAQENPRFAENLWEENTVARLSMVLTECNEIMEKSYFRSTGKGLMQ